MKKLKLSHEELLKKMNECDKGYFITDAKDARIDSNADDLHIPCKIKGTDEYTNISVPSDCIEYMVAGNI